MKEAVRYILDLITAMNCFLSGKEPVDISKRYDNIKTEFKLIGRDKEMFKVHRVCERLKELGAVRVSLAVNTKIDFGSQFWFNYYSLFYLVVVYSDRITAFCVQRDMGMKSASYDTDQNVYLSFVETKNASGMIQPPDRIHEIRTLINTLDKMKSLIDEIIDDTETKSEALKAYREAIIISTEVLKSNCVSDDEIKYALLELCVFGTNERFSYRMLEAAAEHAGKQDEFSGISSIMWKTLLKCIEAYSC